MCELRIEVKDNVANVFSPYNPIFVSAIKERIGGRKWNATEKCWSVPVGSIENVRNIMKEVYGESDIEKMERVTVTFKANRDLKGQQEPLILFGKIIGTARGRDSGAFVGEDVVITEGEITSGGSCKNWLTVLKENSIVTVRNVLKTKIEENEERYTILSIEEQTKTNDINKNELLAEKERLLKRLAEIEELLKK